jgi:hypothetical protein
LSKETIYCRHSDGLGGWLRAGKIFSSSGGWFVQDERRWGMISVKMGSMQRVMMCVV